MPLSDRLNSTSRPKLEFKYPIKGIPAAQEDRKITEAALSAELPADSCDVRESTGPAGLAAGTEGHGRGHRRLGLRGLPVKLPFVRATVGPGHLGRFWRPRLVAAGLPGKQGGNLRRTPSHFLGTTGTATLLRVKFATVSRAIAGPQTGGQLSHGDMSRPWAGPAAAHVSSGRARTVMATE